MAVVSSIVPYVTQRLGVPGNESSLGSSLGSTSRGGPSRGGQIGTQWRDGQEDGLASDSVLVFGPFVTQRQEGLGDGSLSEISSIFGPFGMQRRNVLPTPENTGAPGWKTVIALPGLEAVWSRRMVEDTPWSSGDVDGYSTPVGGNGWREDSVESSGSGGIGSSEIGTKLVSVRVASKTLAGTMLEGIMLCEAVRVASELIAGTTLEATTS